MLKKAGIVVAMTTAGMLALSPFAYADQVNVNNQSNSQSSNQGNGTLNGNVVGSGNSVQVCNTSVSVPVVIAVPIGGAVVVDQNTIQGGGNCSSTGTAVGQNTQQNATNKNRNRKN